MLAPYPQIPKELNFDHFPMLGKIPLRSGFPGKGK
jgi:hypothetical protein